MRRTSTAMAVGAVTAVLSAVVLAGCGPNDTGAKGGSTDPKPGTTSAAGVTTPPAAPATSAPTTAAPTTPSRTPATHDPATSTALPHPTRTPKARAKPPVAPAILATGASSEKVRELQARLGQLHFFSRTPTGYYGSVTQHAVSDFQERHGLAATGSVSQATWDKLVALTARPTHQQMYPTAPPPPAGKLDARCMTGHAMCISKTTRTLSWVVDGKVRSTMAVRFGSQYTPTREGLFKVNSKAKDWVSTIYHTPMPYAMFFSGGQAVHYSSDFAARGYAGASHGCVNVRDKAALAALFAQVKVGDKVVVYW